MTKDMEVPEGNDFSSTPQVLKDCSDLCLQVTLQNGIMYLMGGLDRYIGRYIGRYSTEYRSMLDRAQVDNRSSIDQYLTNSRLIYNQ